MANAIPFQLITPLAVKFDGEAELVIAVGTEGEVGILPSHAPYLTALRPGVLRANVRDAGGGTRRLELACSEGFMQALPGKVTVLADAALERDEIDIAQARADLEAAHEEQRAAGGDLAAMRRALTKIDYAHARLSVAGVG
ncbi:MAG TPA: ATP synthase F1 subunit epsilon [Candidatus Elarobacter sp.]|nr:ATP synthase F1 subunit epsilon [Candidatus Elarobacter sp.]